MDEELVVLLDDNGNEVGASEKFSAHHANTPLHKAFSCYIFNKQGELLVTKRADSKKVWPGVWTNSACGHPGPGETDTDAIHRRVMYELGMSIDRPVCIVAKYRYKTPLFNGIIEHEECPIYRAQVIGEFQPNPSEVCDYKWINWGQYVQELEHDQVDVYSWWSKDQLKHVQQPITDYLKSLK
ncbi:isopentenyl-diphosphate Delta-isomerase [Candidatus Saccharibacteria bacterium]|nr:isopentenyl-diphosphate Delta-isomerase [Candidatus Saccharibacteria bacterium]